MRYRTPTKKSKYHIPREDYITAVHWCLRYPLWIAELRTLADTSKAITYDKDKVQTSNGYDATADTAIRRVELMKKVQLLESTAEKVDHDLKEYLILAVTQGLTIYQLIQRGMPYDKNVFSDRRQKFYYEISKKI